MISENTLINKITLVISFFITFVSYNNAQVVINEYSAANLKTIADDFQGYEDWIELYNTATEDMDISGYFISDNPDEPKKWQLPQGVIISGNGYHMIWCDGRDTVKKVGSTRYLHTNFKLTQTKKKAETITLSDANGKKIDEIKVQKTRAEQSRGRLTNGNSTWVIFIKPTPKAINTGDYFTNNAEKPEFSVKAGFYDDTINVSIKTKEENATIYYTINGAEPTISSQIYTAPIQISKTAILKAITISNDIKVQASLTEFSSYFIKNKHTIKVVSISGGTTLEQLANGNKNLFPFGTFEIFDEKGERKSISYGEFNSHGQDSWQNKQRSLDFVSRDECGYSNAIKDQMFKLSERDEYQRIILRAAGDDNYPNGSGTKGGGAHMRDAYLQNLVKKGGMHLDVRTGEKAIIYLNGKYWGVYDLRERPDDGDYTEYYYGQDKYNLQYLQTWASTWAEYGGTTALDDWKKMTTYIQKNSLKDSTAYKYVTDRVDVKSLTDYIIANSVSVCSDWINYNTGWWRGLNPEGQHKKWGYQLWDNDATFGYYINYTRVPDTAATKAKPCHVDLLSDSVVYVIKAAVIAKDTVKISGKTYFPGDTISKAKTAKEYVDLNQHMKLYSKLRQNPEFNQYYLTRYADLMNTVFSKENMLAYFDEVYNTIKPEMPQHVQRWGGTMTGWEANVKRFRDYIVRRTDYLEQGMKDCYQLSGPYDVTFDIAGTQDATLTINSQTIDKFPYVSKYFGNIDTKITAQSTSDKFEFDRWSSNKNTLNPQKNKSTALVNLKEGDKVVATFVKAIISTIDNDEQLTQNELKVFPTLFSNNLTLNYHLIKASNVNVSLKDINGRTVIQVNDYNKFHQEGDYKMTISLENQYLTSGMYFLDFETDDFHQTTKLIKIEK
jgi:hypothetical protein